MGRKTELTIYTAMQLAVLSEMVCQHRARKTVSLIYKTANQQSFFNKSHGCSPIWRKTNPFILLFIFSFVLQRLVNEKFHFKRKNPTFRRSRSE